MEQQPHPLSTFSSVTADNLVVINLKEVGASPNQTTSQHKQQSDITQIVLKHLQTSSLWDLLETLYLTNMSLCQALTPML